MVYDTRVNESYMNESRPHSNESSFEDRMTKNDLRIKSQYICQQGARSFLVAQS